MRFIFLKAYIMTHACILVAPFFDRLRKRFLVAHVLEIGYVVGGK